MFFIIEKQSKNQDLYFHQNYSYPLLFILNTIDLSQLLPKFFPLPSLPLLFSHHKKSDFTYYMNDQV